MKRLASWLLTGALFVSPAAAQTYYVYANAESEDEVALIRFDGEQAEVVKTIPVGAWPTEIEGPHGITVDPDGKHWYLTMAHGVPFGKLYKFETGTDRVVGEVELGLYPATMQLSPATGLLYVVNFNLHGDHVPSTVSVVEPETMTEIAQVETGIMPHGSRISPDGMHQYSVAMMSDELFEMDALSLEISRRLNVNPSATILEHHGTAGMDHTMNHEAPPAAPPEMAHEGGHNPDHHGGMTEYKPAKPTWAMPHPSKPIVYVANNGIDMIAEVDLDTWSISRTFKTEKAPYNIDITPDGTKLVVTHKGAASVGIIDTATGEYLAVVPSTRKITHGVAVSPDGKYAFATAEGIGGEPGAVDVIDLTRLEKVATVDIGKQAGGIAFWKMTP
ncbi:MAG: cytochrome D1 domain-containing protein [Rhodothermales bacterium]